ncbi:MAG: sensor histidine kinase [Methanolobus sp.]|nr:sensor histidine kinase [Methanolobus sp.]
MLINKELSGSFVRMILLLLIINAILVPVINCEPNSYRIGVLSVYGDKENSMELWTPTANYLSLSIPNSSFEIVPLDYDDFALTVGNDDVDFFYANPMLYVEMERNYGASRIATFHPVWNNSPYSGLGGVIIANASRDDINSVQDLEGRSFMAVSEFSFGGFLAAMGELQRSGIDFRKDLGEIKYGHTHDNVVFAIVKGDVDAGTVRAGTLEKMVLEGKINIEDVKVLDQKEYDDYPFLASTDIYPGWAFAKTSSTPDNISKEVSIALLRIAPNSTPAIALASNGWSVPADYSSIDELMRELRIGPYIDYGVVSLADVLVQHWYVFILILMLFIIIEVHSRLAVEKIKKSKLETSNKLKDLFTDIMRHDLLNPASIIKGFTDVLYTNEIDTEKKETLKLINEHTDHLISMIGSAAKLAKLESYEEMEFETKDLGFLLLQVADSFSSEFANKDIALGFDSKGTYPSRINDVMEDVFSNLISNALKYSSSGSTVKLEILDVNNSWKIMVTDEGDGIPDKIKPYIFERFKRADKKGIKGTGLGLAIVKRIVDLHKGTVGVEDNPQGKGSVFWVMLDKA